MQPVGRSGQLATWGSGWAPAAPDTVTVPSLRLWCCWIASIYGRTQRLFEQLRAVELIRHYSSIPIPNPNDITMVRWLTMVRLRVERECDVCVSQRVCALWVRGGVGYDRVIVACPGVYRNTVARKGRCVYLTPPLVLTRGRSRRACPCLMAALPYVSWVTWGCGCGCPNALLCASRVHGHGISVLCRSRSV
jgi:hypothetical protein